MSVPCVSERADVTPPQRSLRESDVLECVSLAYFLDRFESLELTSPETCLYSNIAKQRANVSGEYLGLIPWGFVLIRVWFCVVLCRARAQLS